MEKRPWWILPVIIFSQFAGTSLWFAGNAVLGDLQQEQNLAADSLGYITSAVQLGFVSGTLVFAFFTISDQFSPRIVFFVCSLLGALSNLGVYALAQDFWSLLLFRFMTGFFLAGIYPVGMKIAAGWYQRGLGNAIGFLVGALVVGTAFPHLLKGLGQSFAWEAVILAVCGIAVLGGLSMLWLVPDGPFLARGTRFDPKALAVIFRSRPFRASAFGYFGHMWELYAFWAFVPFALAAHSAQVAGSGLNISFWSFASSRQAAWAAPEAGSFRSRRVARGWRSRNSCRRACAARFRRCCSMRRRRSFSLFSCSRVSWWSATRRNSPS